MGDPEKKKKLPTWEEEDAILRGIGRINDFDLGEAMERQRLENRAYNDALRARAKPLHELLIREDFTVISYVGHPHPHSITPGPLVIGGHNPSYGAGYSRTVEIEVKPSDERIPVRTLLFYGFYTPGPGDKIRATIPCHQELEFKNETLDWGMRSNRERQTLYGPRELGEREEAIEIGLVVEGNVFGTERSVNYPRYQKP